MSKNQNQNSGGAFGLNKPVGPAPSDPMAEAKKADESALAGLAVKPATVAPETGAAAAPKQPAPEVIEEQAKVSEANGKVAVEAPVVAVARIAPREADNTVVRRPDGGSTRESSPQAKVSIQTLQPGASFQSLISNERRAGTPAAQYLISFMDSYIVSMAPGRTVTTDSVLKFQEGLHDVIVHVIERAPSTEFKRLWNILIAYFVEYKTHCFAPRYYGRGAKDWKRNPEQFTVLQALVNLLYVSASDIKTVNQNVNINSVMGSGFSEEGRGRVISFYLK